MWKCSKCQALVEDTDVICPVCGQAKEYNEETVQEVVEEAPDAAIEEVVEETADEAIEEVSEEVASFDEPKDWVCPACGADCEEEACPVCGLLRVEAYDLAEIAPKRNNKVIVLVAAVAAVVLLTVGIFSYYFLNRYVDRSGGNGSITYSDITDACDGIFGNDVVIKVNGLEIDRTIFESYLTNTGLYYQQNYCYNELGQLDVSRLNDFKWTDVADAETGETHREKVITEAFNSCVEIYTVLGLGKKYNISPSQVELEAIDDQLKGYEKQYGDNFQNILKLNGYENVDQFKAILTLDAEMAAVYADIDANPDRYIGEDHSIYNVEDPQTISVKHILIAIDEENGVNDKAAKKEANKVLKKIKNGEDFDSLIEEYNDDPGQPKDGYSFGKGEMVEEFERAAFALKIGEISGLVKTDYGYHIIKRVVSIDEAMVYAVKNSKVLVNKSLLNNIKIKADLKKILEEEQKQTEKAAEEAEADTVTEE